MDRMDSMERTAGGSSTAAAEPGRLWADSGAQWLTAAEVGVPVALVERVVGIVQRLDGLGAGLADESGPAGLGLLAERAAALGSGPSSAISCGGATRLLRAGDGWLALALARPSDVELLPALFEAPVPQAGGGEAPWEVVASLVRGSPVRHLVERATLLGVACAAVGEETDAEPMRSQQVGEAAASPVNELVVVNLGSLWAAPLAADVLARLGARVITVESARRPDGARATPAFFDALHGRCELVALELDTSLGRQQLAELLQRADVVLEGSRPRALQQMGIEARAVLRGHPRIWVSITGHGHRAPHRVGFGDDAAAAGGLVGRVASGPVFVADAVADPVTGLTAAMAVADLASAGGRWHVDIALSRVARSCADGRWAPAVHGPRPPRLRRASVTASTVLGRDTARLAAELDLTTIGADP